MWKWREGKGPFTEHHQPRGREGMIENHYRATTVTKTERTVQNNSSGFFKDGNFINDVLLPLSTQTQETGVN